MRDLRPRPEHRPHRQQPQWSGHRHRTFKRIETEANWDGSKLEWNQIGSRGHLGQASPRKPHFGRSLELEFIWEAKIGSVPGRTPPRPGNRSFQAQERQRLSSVVQIQLGGEVEPGCEEFSCFEDKRLRTKTKTKGRGETCRLAKGQSLLFLVAGRIQGCNFLQHPHAGPWKPCGNVKLVWVLAGWCQKLYQVVLNWDL